MRDFTNIITDTWVLYVLLPIVGSAGLAMIAAGAAQWVRGRKLRQNWLFPAAPDEGQPFAGEISRPVPLIAKKQALPIEDQESERHAQRRAA
jgi:hypothetical protein